MEDYKSNSYKSRNTKTPDKAKKTNKVVTGSTKIKKKSEVQKFAEVFIADDMDNVKGYIFEDVIVPEIKNILLDVVEALLGFSPGGSRHSSGKSSKSRESYSSYYYKQRDEPANYPKQGYDYGNVICENHRDADTILRTLDEMIDVYGAVRVADLYEAAGISGSYTDNNYGWTDIRDAKIVRLRSNQYEIRMPRVMQLN